MLCGFMNIQHIKNSIWFITGGSKGMGLHLAKRLLNSGAKVAVTSRSRAAVLEKLGAHGNLLALATDLADEGSVRAAVSETIARFGGLDVVVNNAGYGQFGAVEEVSDAEARANFDVNVFGVLNVLRATLPQLRQQRSGHIFNIASIAGLTGAFPGFGVYSATKFAVAGLSEGLQADVAELGVKVTCVYPGYFRTDFLAAGSPAQPATQIADYRSAHDLVAMHVTGAIHGNQPGDPDKLAEVLMTVATQANPPLHLVLGSDALGLAEKKAEALRDGLQANRAMSVSTDFAAARS
jgi:NAD(P)-dependent dehydrogenase (short-subunit alcohol dehydrogenase family)